MKDFTFIQKLAVLKSLDSVMLADGKIDPREETFLKNILNEMAMESFMVDEARKVSVAESIDILRRMSAAKKASFAALMHQMVIVDKDIDKREVNLLIDLFREAEIDIEHPPVEEVRPDLTFIYFESSNHNIYDNGLQGARENRQEPVMIRIELLPLERDRYHLYIQGKREEPGIWGSDLLQRTVELELTHIEKDKAVYRDKTNHPAITVTVRFEGPDLNAILIHYEDKDRYVEYMP